MILLDYCTALPYDTFLNNLARLQRLHRALLPDQWQESRCQKFDSTLTSNTQACVAIITHQTPSNYTLVRPLTCPPNVDAIRTLCGSRSAVRTPLLLLRPGHDVKLHPHFHCHWQLFVLMCHEAGQSAFLHMHSCICLRILIIYYLATFLGTDSLSVLMCRKAVNQSISCYCIWHLPACTSRWWYVLYTCSAEWYRLVLR